MNLHELLDEGENINWDAVADRLRTHPHEASEWGRRFPSPLELALRKDSPPPEPTAIRALIEAHSDALQQVDEFGRSVLHVACVDGARPEIARVLLDAKPDLASQRTVDGWIPLHFARCEEMARLLICAFPTGVSVEDHAGRIPLHFAACQDTPPEVVRLLLEEGTRQQHQGNNNASGVLHKSKKGKTPLNIICSKIGKAAGVNRMPCVWEWEKLTLMLKTAASSLAEQGWQESRKNRSSSGMFKFRLLHAVVELQCPIEIVRYALAQNPEQTKERDWMGRTPLFIAVSTRGTTPEVIETILFACPSAGCIADYRGRLPLHAAAEAGITYEGGLRSVMYAHPSALEVRDLVCHMHPFMLAAKSDTGEKDTNTVYCLLRKRPDILAQTALGDNELTADQEAMCKCFAL
eukprot:CAMPEP_0197444046 /NCGR_PEP_ID=MMETSP1175-20131217/9628_1 /TAXON_ID=1003142 /ORGANISM="Triceratium dubium, Strain CCMP147" /LENGTH=406 /DNA_ID=CAMNT_0042974765 /DNA_START=70 /DNA_END=1290 /DNA_ORIENTATION=+